MVAPETPNSYHREVQIFQQLCARKFTQGNLILNVGCARGEETIALQDRTGATIVGIDLKNSFSPLAKGKSLLLMADAMLLPFQNEKFDAVYCYHVLEHLSQPGKAIAEFYRILKSDGILYIGVPNKSRIIGYINARGVSYYKRIKWNVSDLIKRLSGRFENRFGAHAGFTKRELESMLTQHFPYVMDVRGDYYRVKYKSYQRLVNSLIRLNLDNLFFPSNYFLCKK